MLYQTNTVDLFGPMSFTKHAVIVLNLKSGFLAAKLVSYTSTYKVIPVLIEFYDTYPNSAICNSQKTVVLPAVTKNADL